MIDKIAREIKARLKGLGLFKAVERTVTGKVLSSPPSAAMFLAYDRAVVSSPMVTRELGWDLVLLIPVLGADKGQGAAGACIDAVRAAFTGWRPWEGGTLPAEVPEIRMEGIEQTMLVYTARLTMKVIPAVIDKEITP
ncbi:MAG: hypothetical protein P4L42_15450 [Desulfocapsaceae bacterium]|nr:hypothetical protein [Desulfocapsaceae bacterium]